ncbi:MAG TPA: 2Fe-2S iron-sulfur cluster-binding protein [Caulobacteraceae bacterium]|jgi:aerobic-type carbon monoxide dehydrogenase small subunit (CoxS/CutS family)|nr:2Fe-2S iron-sulfur cluster-binding protein [Caulobacteraceae bacterium]
MTYAITVNGRGHVVDCKPDLPLVWVLRDLLGPGVVMIGCGRGNCGACTVRLNGEIVHSCSVPIAAAAGGVITTPGYRAPA